MTEVTENEDQAPVESELDALIARAALLGIKHHPSIGIDKLKDKIAEATEKGVSKPGKADEPETDVQAKVRMKKEATRLIRVRVACMNPNKSEWEGEIFTTGNGIVGTVKKFVKFDEEWHVPKIILDMMDARRCQTFYTKVDKDTRRKSRVGKLVKEFSIEILPDLTKDELHDLAQRQAMANGTAE